MIYWYLIRVEYYCGDKPFIKEYRKTFLEIGELFVYLETKHKDNYRLILIRPLKYYNGYQKITGGF